MLLSLLNSLIDDRAINSYKASQLIRCERLFFGDILRMKDWLIERLKQKSTLEGVMFIAAGIAFILFKSLAVLIAYAAIAYGAWKIYKN
jgi:hypothetical protein